MKGPCYNQDMAFFRFFICTFILIMSVPAFAEDENLADLIDAMPLLEMGVEESLNTESTPEAEPESQDAETSPYADYPQILLDNSQKVYDECKRDKFQSEHFDCRCRAISYLDEAIHHDPSASISGVMNSVTQTCPNLVEMTGSAYTECATKGVAMNIKKDREAFCACYGRTYARAISSMRGHLSNKALVTARRFAIKNCR